MHFTINNNTEYMIHAIHTLHKSFAHMNFSDKIFDF